MKPKPIRDGLLALLALIFALAASYWLDQSIFFLRMRAAHSFDYTFLNWAPALAILTLAAGLVALVRWLASRADFSRVVDVIYVLAGLGPVLLNPLVFALRLSFPLFGVLNSGPVSLWTMTGGILAMAGIFHLFQPRRSA